MPPARSLAAHPYGLLLEAISDGAALLDRHGVVLFGNPSLATLINVPVAQMQGRQLQQYIVPAQRRGFEIVLHRKADRGIARDFSLVQRRGAARPVSIALAALPLAPPHTASAREHSVIMAIVRDLTGVRTAAALGGRLLEGLLSAEEERRRIARELHDETGQSLTALLVGLRTMADLRSLEQAQTLALELRDIAAHTVNDVGRLVRGLHPIMLEDRGLTVAARRYAEDFVRSYGLELTFTAKRVDSPPLSSLEAATMYRILQEALTNVARHARARNVGVHIERRRRSLELLVRDDGRGFDARRASAKRGLGLRGMRERATVLGGSLEIESQSSRRGQTSGTLVRARIPIPPPRARPARDSMSGAS